MGSDPDSSWFSLVGSDPDFPMPRKHHHDVYVRAAGARLRGLASLKIGLPSGELDHPARLHLIDAAGRVREIYSLAFFDEEQAFLDIAALETKIAKIGTDPISRV